MNNKAQFVFLKDTDGDIAQQLNNLNNQKGVTIITYYEHYDKTHDNSGVIACYIKIEEATNESNGTATQ